MINKVFLRPLRTSKPFIGSRCKFIILEFKIIFPQGTVVFFRSLLPPLTDNSLRSGRPGTRSSISHLLPLSLGRIFHSSGLQFPHPYHGKPARYTCTVELLYEGVWQCKEPSWVSGCFNRSKEQWFSQDKNLFVSHGTYSLHGSSCS